MPPLFTKGELKAKSLLPHLFRQNATPFKKGELKTKSLLPHLFKQNATPFFKRGIKSKDSKKGVRFEI